MVFFRRLPGIIRFSFVFMVTVLLLMMAYRFIFFFHFRPPGKALSGSAVIMGLRYDLRVVAIIGLIMYIISGVRLLHPGTGRKTQRVWSVILSLVLLIFLIAYGTDFYYYEYLNQRLNASIISFLADAAISARMVWQTYPVITITMSLIVALILLFFLLKYLLRNFAPPPLVTMSKVPRIAVHITWVLLLALAIFGKIGQYPLRWSDAFTLKDEFKAQAALNPFQSFMSSLKFRKSGFDLKAVQEAYPLVADYLGVTNPDQQTLNYTRVVNYPPVSQKRNVVIVICESFSAYKSSMFGNKLDPTPYFRSMCDNGSFFERCFTPAFGTARGVWATLTGIPDVEYPNTASRNPAMVNQHTIMNDFAGYEKMYFLGGSTTWANIRGVLNNNIDGLRIYEEDQFSAGKVDVWGISDKNLFLESNKILAASKQPFISIIQTADNHRPYTIPKEDREVFQVKEYPADTLKKYGFEDNGQFNAFRYTDFCFRQFIEAAKKEAYYANTVFVFVGDHGLRGDAGNLFPEAFTKQNILAEHVPLLFYQPAFVPARRYGMACSQLDLLPSVASLVQQSYTNTTMGRNLFDTSRSMKGLAFIADPDTHTIGVVTDSLYYRRNLETGVKDFVSVRNNDPLPSNPFMSSEKDRMARMTEAFYQTSRYLLTHNKKK